MIVLLAAGALSLAALPTVQQRDAKDVIDRFSRTDAQKEIEIGRSAYDEMVRRGLLSRDPQSTARVRRVFANLVDALPKRDYPYQVVLMAENEINAECLPGGYITMYEGLLSLLKSDEELAFILAHEIGHGAGRHWANKTRKTSDDLARDIVGVTNYAPLRNIAYTRDNERDADAFGIRLYIRAGYPPARASEAIKLLERYFPDDPRTPYYLRSHPTHSERIRAIDRYAAGEPAPLPNAAAVIDPATLLGDLPAGTAAHPLLPLDIGRRWTYRVEAAGLREEYEVEVVGLAEAAGRRVARLRFNAGGEWIDYQCATTGAAMYRRDRPERQGSRWKPVLSTAGGELGGWSFDPPVEEGVKVPAGDFPGAVKIVGRLGKREVSWWIVAGIGIVRKEESPDRVTEVLIATSR